MNMQALLPATVCALAFGVSSAHAEFVLFQDDFSGHADTGGDGLNGETPDVTTGGAVWNAVPVIGANGVVTQPATGATSDNIAYLALGSLINDNRGNADAIYTLSGTVNVTPVGVQATGGWGAFGFWDGPLPENSFGSSTNNGRGVAWMLRRGNGQLRVFRGSSTGNGLTEDTSLDNSLGAIDMQIVLDLTGWDGSTDFGSVTYFAKLSSSSTYTEIASGNLDATNSSFNNVGFSITNIDATVSSFSLTQVPEPGSLALLGLGGLLIARRRRG